MAHRLLSVSRRPWSALERDAFVGRRVVVAGRYWRTIVGTYPDIPGGVILNAPADGFRCWNLDDLRLVGRRA